MKELNQVIARSGYTTLVMDYGCKGYTTGKLLYQGYYIGRLVSDSKNGLIKKFYEERG